MGLRIAQLANFVGPTSGGMRQAIDSLGAGYVREGVERMLVIPGEHDRISETDSGTVVEVASPHLFGHSYRMIAQPWRALSMLDQFQPTSVEVSDKWTLSQAARWARKRGVGSVLFSHERLSDMLSMFLRRQFGVEAAVGALNRRLATEFDAVVVTSDYAAAEFINTGARLARVPLGVDLETFHPRVGTPVDDGILRAAYVGRLSREKSPDLAIRTMLELHRRGAPVQMDVYGTGPDEQELRDLAEGGPVTFHGYVNGRDEVARRYAAADVSLSVCPAETFGLSVLEAQACGTPVVTANRGGGSELVTPESGAQADPDPIALADTIEANIIPRLGPSLRAAARAQAERYPWSRSVQLMLELHERLRREGPYQAHTGDAIREGLSKNRRAVKSLLGRH